ncbi:hypothetical protein HKD37_04G010509 [Glycine soja]
MLSWNGAIAQSQSLLLRNLLNWSLVPSFQPQVSMKLLSVLKDNNEVFGWITHDIKGLDPTLSTHKFNIEEGFPPKWLFQKRLNPNIMEVVKREDVKPTFKTNAHKVKYNRHGHLIKAQAFSVKHQFQNFIFALLKVGNLNLNSLILHSKFRGASSRIAAEYE